MLKSILVPTDGSSLSDKAVRMAIDLAEMTGARLVALNVYPPYAGAPYGTDPPASEILGAAHVRHQRAQAERTFQRIRRESNAAGVELDAIAVEGLDVWSKIIAYARRRKCDLICMASHGRRGLAALVLGSETHKVLVHSHIPVLVVR
jgi:nucleotide-binding universal stress UspA family protein